MSLIQNSSTKVTQNMNFLSPVGFRLVLKNTPNVEFFCQSATLPSVSLSEAVQNTPLVMIYRPGDKLTYEPFSLRFKLDENMTNYREIYNWMLGLGHPSSLNQYKNLSEKTTDASVVILSSNNNPLASFNFTEVFPVSLSGLTFDVTQTDIEYLEAEVSFRYRDFSLEIY
jgi:hypothetical protein